MAGQRTLRVRSGISRIVDCFAILALLAATLSTTADAYPEANSSSPAHPSSLDKSFRKNLPDFGEVTTTLYRGGQPSKAGFRTLAKMGINIVVDLRGSRESERRIVTHLGMQYVPLHWHCWFPRDETFAKFLTLLRQNPGKKIFVHCRLGDDRTGMMVCGQSRKGNGEVWLYLRPPTSDLPRTVFL